MTPDGATRVLAAGTVLGARYRLDRRVAAGGMATVWLAHDEDLDRPVAVKALADVLADDPSYLARFRREARIAAGLTHPNLVRIFDFSGEAERPYLVMEYIDGGTLAGRIAAGAGGELDARRLAEELLGALACIHAAGVVHRDVKPSNVLIDRDGRARLTDFGIAQPEDATRITRTGEVIGTLKYMAPELLEGEPATQRSDLYSSGVLLGECLGDDPPPQLVALTDLLTSPDPAARPASAEEALGYLDTAAAPTKPVSTKPLIAPSASPPVSAAPTAGRKRQIGISGRRVLAGLAGLALVAAAVAVAVALGGGGSEGTPTADSGGTQPVSPPTQTVTTTQTTQVPAEAPPSKPKPEAKKPPAEENKPPSDEKLPPGQEKKQEKGD